jgi:hypothetical protein
MPLRAYLQQPELLPRQRQRGSISLLRDREEQPARQHEVGSGLPGVSPRSLQRGASPGAGDAGAGVAGVGAGADTGGLIPGAGAGAAPVVVNELVAGGLPAVEIGL